MVASVSGSLVFSQRLLGWAGLESVQLQGKNVAITVIAVREGWPGPTVCYWSG